MGQAVIFPILRNAFEKRGTSFRSDLDAETVLQRLKSVVRRRGLRNWMIDCLIGKVSRDVVIISRHQAWQRNPIRPTFFGVLRTEGSSTIVEGYFAYSWVARFFLLYGLGFVVLLASSFAAFAVAVVAAYRPVLVEPWVLMFLLAVSALVGFGAHKASQPLSEEDIEWISAQLRTALRAT